MSCSRRLFLSAIACSMFSGGQPATGMLWQREASRAKSENPENEMAFVARLRYTRLSVLGGCGIAVDEQHIVTAKHAVDDWSAANVQVQIAEKTRPVERVWMHPDSATDLAVLRLKQPFVDSHSLALYAGRTDIGDRVWLGGYGISGPLDAMGLPGKFVSGFNRIVRVQPHRAQIAFDGPGPDAEAEEVFPSLMDSGSPTFLFRRKQWLLNGITTSVSNRTAPHYGDRSSHELLSAARPWLDSIVPELAWVAASE